MNYKLLTIITLAVLSVSAVYLLADTDESAAATDGDWTFNVVDGNATITKKSGTGITNLVIPSTVSDGTNTYNVTAIGDNVNAIVENSKLSSNATLTIPDSVTTIQKYAFSGCAGLTSLDLGDGVETIGNIAFSRCTGLTSVTIPDSVTSIGQSAFQGCTGLTSVIIGDSVTSIGQSAFQGCTGLTSVTIPDSVTSFGYGAFLDCTGLTSVTIPDSVTRFGNSMFKGCTGLTSVTIPDSVTNTGTNVFQGCTGLTSVTIPDSVTTIGMEAFSGCTGVTTLTIEGSPSTIGTDAFNMSALETVYNLGDNDTIVAGAYGIPSTATVLRSMNTFTYSIVDNHAVITGTTGDTWETIEIPAVITDGGVDYPVRAIMGTGPIISDAQIPTTATLTIPDSVTVIGDSAFYNCSHITGSLTIPDSVTTIGARAFYGCSGFTSVTLPDGLTTIASSVFENCTGLTSVTLPDNVTTIGDSAFDHCSGLTSVTLPDGLTSIGDYAFGYCSGLTSVTLPDGLTSLGTACFQYTGLTGTLIIPDSVTTIGASAFRGCTGLTGLDLGAGVVEIKLQAFYDCTGLTGTLIIPDSVTTIGKNAFANTRFNSLVFLGSPSTVGDPCFGPSIREVLNLGTNEITTTSYGLSADEVRNDIPGSSYIAPNTVTKTETNDGPAYDIIIMLPLIMILGVVLIAIWGLRDKF